MTKAEKQLERMRRNPKGVSFDDLIAIAGREGFMLRSVRGSHFQFRHPNLPEVLTVPARSPVKPVYVQYLLRLIDRLHEEE